VPASPQGEKGGRFARGRRRADEASTHLLDVSTTLFLTELPELPELLGVRAAGKFDDVRSE
jgi:hypothetical protein